MSDATGPGLPDDVERIRRHAAEIAERRRLLEWEPGALRDIDVAAECLCSCHPQPADPDLHRGRPCPCQLTPEELRSARSDALKVLDEHANDIDAAMRERDRQIAAVAADLGIEATQANPYAPWVIEGRVDGRSFCMRERWDAYTLEVASDDDPTATPWTTGDPTRRITVCTGDATDLGPVDRPPDYRPALTFITVAIRGFLRRRTCDHPHSTGDWFCPRCGESLVDLTHPTAEPASASDDAEKTITSTEPTRMRDGRNLQAVAGANVTLRDAEIPLTDAQADVRDADQTLIAAIGVSLAAGDSWAMIAIAMGTTEAHVRASYGPRVGELQ